MPVLAKDLRYGPFQPDLPEYNNPGSSVITNVIPVAGGYEPTLALEEIGGALGGTPLGAFSALDNSGNVINFAADDGDLYKQNAGTLNWDVVSKAGGYTTGADDFWSFTQFGNFVIATNFADAVQVFELGVSTLFADLGGSPPKAKYVATVREFVMFAYLDESGTVDPFGVRWSANGDHTSYPTVGADAAIAVQSDRVTLESQFGFITGMTTGLQGGDVVIYQKRGLTRGLFTGSPFFFTFDQIEGSRGTDAPNSIVEIGGYNFYLAEDGFYAFDGVNSVPIGAQKVDRTLFSTISSDFNQVFGTADPTKKIIYWAFPTVSSTPDTMFIYSWDIQEWSKADGYSVVFLNRSLTNGFTLETLDTISTSLDLLPASLDSREFQGGELRIGAWTTDNKFASFSGTTLEATVDTTLRQITQTDRLAFVREIWPHVQNANDADITSALGHQYQTNDGIVYTGFTSINAMGFCPLRVTARFGRVRTKIAAGATWDFIHSCDVVGVGKGRR
jgi:hypothetical protein